MRVLLKWGAKGHKSGPELNNKRLPVMEYLRMVDVFSAMSQEEIAPLFKGVQPLEYPSGTLLFTPDDPYERLFVLKKGRIDVYRLTPTGKRLVVRRLDPITIFGEMGMMGQTLQGCFAEAAEPSLLCVATREHLEEVLKQHPDVAVRMLQAVGSRLGELEERLEQALFSPVKVRLANFLLTNMDTATGVISDYTHEDIGDTIGALRQTVTEALNLMRDQGLVEIERKQIRVINRQKLAGAAFGEEPWTGTRLAR